MKICKKKLHHYESALKQCPKCRKTYVKNKVKAVNAAWYQENKEHAKLNNKLYKESNPEKVKAKDKKWLARNKKRKSATDKKWLKANKVKDNKTRKVWRDSNPGLTAARLAKRRAFKLNATPKWLTQGQLAEIKQFYTETKELQWLSDPSDPLEVDHIVPLQGKDVCGLHVPWNLQILPRSLNRSKHNR